VHLEMAAEANIAAGRSAEKARYAAQRQFGGVLSTRSRKGVVATCAESVWSESCHRPTVPPLARNCRWHGFAQAGGYLNYNRPAGRLCFFNFEEASTDVEASGEKPTGNRINRGRAGQRNPWMYPWKSAVIRGQNGTRDREDTRKREFPSRKSAKPRSRNGCSPQIARIGTDGNRDPQSPPANPLCVHMPCAYRFITQICLTA